MSSGPQRRGKGRWDGGDSLPRLTGSPTVLQCTEWFLCQLQSPLMQSNQTAAGWVFFTETAQYLSPFFVVIIQSIIYVYVMYNTYATCMYIVHCVIYILYKTLSMNGMNDCTSSECPHPPLSDWSSQTIPQYTEPLFVPVETQLINNWRGGYWSLLLCGRAGWH